MSKEEKLDWIYKNANSLVDREEYLLGRKVDKTLEQINDEEKDKKFVLPTPKNHVEHECIPPSIRDFNKIVQSEQVDLSAKLQEDPLVAIKKREEEARRQFLQNPVQLKKLQDALMKKEGEKKKKTKKRCLDLDQQIKEKLKALKSGQLGTGTISKKDAKKEKDDVLNTILMHKFNALKDKLSEDDLNDILNGKISDISSDEGKSKKKFKEYNSSESECEGPKRTSRNTSKYYGRKRRSRSKSGSKDSNTKSTYRQSSDIQRTSNTGSRNKKYSSSEEEIHHDRERKGRQADEERRSLYRKGRTRSRSRSDSRRRDNLRRRENRESNSKDYLENPKVNKQYTNRKVDRENSTSVDNESVDSELMRSRTDSRGRDNSRRREDRENKSKSYLENAETRKQYTNRDLNRDSTGSNDESSDSELDKKIMERLKLLREENETRLKVKTSSLQENSDSKRKLESQKEEPHYRYSDSDDENPQLKYFGLVTSDGKKIALKRSEGVKKVDARPANKTEESAKPQGKQVKRMTEAEKERLRKEMMRNAKVRDREREENIKRYKEKDKKEEELVSKKYDADLLHTELLKSAKHSSVEQRIKSNLNNIQRSSRHMDQNFSKR